MLFFALLLYMVGAYACKYFFGVDFILNPAIINEYEGNIAVLNSMKLLQVCLTIGVFIIPAWSFPKAIDQVPQSYLTVSTKPSFIYVLLGVLVVIVASPFVSYLIQLNQQLTLPASMQALEQSMQATEEAAAKLTKAFLSGSSMSDLYVNLLVVALVPAIAEEFLFRGIIQRFMIQCFERKHAAIFATAILFTTFHMQFYGFVPRLFLGMILGYLFLCSGSIWVPIIAHFFNNAISVLIVFYKWDTKIVWLSEAYVFPWYVIAVSALMSVGLIVYAWYVNKNKIDDRQLE